LVEKNNVSILGQYLYKSTNIMPNSFNVNVGS
jgi:hypothetical protein